MITVQVDCYTEQSLTNPHIDAYKTGIYKAPGIYNLSAAFNVSSSDEVTYVKYLCLEGLAQRYHNISPLLHDRLKYELNLFNQVEGIYSFLLFISDFLKALHTLSLSLLASIQ